MENFSHEAIIWVVEKQNITKSDEELLQPLFNYIQQRFQTKPRKEEKIKDNSAERPYFVIDDIEQPIQHFMNTSLKSFGDAFSDFVGKRLKTPLGTANNIEPGQNWLVLRVVLPIFPNLIRSVELFNQIFYLF
jgi:hypothetical protein